MKFRAALKLNGSSMSKFYNIEKNYRAVFES